MNEIPLILKVVTVIMTAGSMVPASRRGMEEYIGSLATKIVIGIFMLLTIMTLFGHSPASLFVLMRGDSGNGNRGVIVDISDWEDAKKGRSINIFGDMLFKSWAVRTNYISSAKIEFEMDGKYICTIQFSTDGVDSGEWKSAPGQSDQKIGVFDASEDFYLTKDVTCLNYPFHLTGIHTLGVSGNYSIGEKNFKFSIHKDFKTDEIMYSPEVMMNDQGKVSLMFPLG